jgi:PA14 domain/Putative phage tail protein
MGIFGDLDASKTKTIDNVAVTSSKQNDPIPVGMGQFKASQCLIYKGAVQEQQIPSQGKGGGKGTGYFYYAPVMAALCNGPAVSIGNVWSNQTWLQSANGAEGITISSTYSPQNYALVIADNGAALANTYSSTYNDYGLPAATVLSGTDGAPMQAVTWWQSGYAYGPGLYVWNGTDVYISKVETDAALSNTTDWTNTGASLTTGQYCVVPFSLGSITLTAAGNASGGNTVYTASSTTLSPFSGASGGLVGFRFTVTGFPNAANNGTFVCTASSSTSLTLNNANGVAQTHAGSAEDIAYHYHFSTADAGKSAQIWYQFNYSLISEQDTAIVPSSAPIGGSTVNYAIQLSNQYTPTSIISVQYYGEDNPNAGQTLTQVSSTPTVAGTYRFFGAVSVGGQSPITYIQLSSGDENEELLITWAYTNQSAVGQSAPELINFTFFGGSMGQPVQPELISGGQWQLGGGSSNVASGYAGGNPASALAYTGIAGIFYFPMFLQESGQVQDNTFEVLTPDAYGGGVTDCNPVLCVERVLTDTRWGLGSGTTPFPTSAIDNSTNGTWGGPAGTPGARQTGSTAWNYCAANNFFISPFIEDSTSAADEMSKWMEAGQIGVYMSEGLMKLVPYGSQSAAANGCTWTAPQDYVVALDDTCFLPDGDGKDPVKLTRATYLDGYNKVQIGYSNRQNQYEDDGVQEWDQASINRWGLRTEEPQSWSFIRTQAAATYAASMRVKRYVTLFNTYEFRLPFIYGYLEPMDIVTITTSSSWAAGLNNVNSNIVTLPVQITKIVDDPIQGLKITAEDYIAAAKLPTLYNKSISQASGSVNALVNPGDSQVVAFECTARMSQQRGNTIAIGACGTSSNWGSCNMWVSYDGETYKQIGTIENPSRIGVLYDTLATGSDPDTANNIVVQMVENSGALNAGSDTDADNLTTACYVGAGTTGETTEVIGYSALSMTGDNQYTLTGYLRRGQLGTSIGSHTAGAPFLVLDESVFYWQYDPIWAGQTIYLKAQSVNIFNQAPQLLSSLTPITFVIPGLNPGTIDASSGLNLIANYNGTGYGPLGWAPVYTNTYAASLNIGASSYGYSGMNTTYGSGVLSGVNYDYFYNRFTGYLIPSLSGEYTVGLNSDDGANLYIGGMQVATDNLATQRAMSANLTYSTGSSATIQLTKNVAYPIVVEWENGIAPWGLQLLWTPPKSSTEVIPLANLSTSTTANSSGLNLNIWVGSPGLWFPSGNGLVDPANKTLYGPPTNGGGSNIVSGVTTVTNLSTSPASGPAFTVPGWIVGQIYNPAGQFEIEIPSTASSNEGYIFNFTQNASSYPCYLVKSSSFSANTQASPAGITYYGTTQAATTGWMNVAIYIGANGYMSAWVNGNIVVDCQDYTYTPNPAALKYGITPGWSSLGTYKLAPAPNASGAGSTGLNPQGSVSTVSDYTFSYTSTSSTITWSWGAFSVYCPDGSSYSVAASTGSATTHTSLSTTVSGTAPMEWTGLTASTTYYFTPFVQLNSNGTGTVFMMATGLSAPTLAQQMANNNADGNVSCSGSVYVTAATGASGGGTGGGGGGGGGRACFSPNTKVKTQRGDIAIVEIVPYVDKVLTARGTWKTVHEVTTRDWTGSMLAMGSEELSTTTHHVIGDEFFALDKWTPMHECGLGFPTVHYEGTIHNLHVVCAADDDGTAPDTEHSYTLANGLVVHNMLTAD